MAGRGQFRASIDLLIQSAAATVVIGLALALTLVVFAAFASALVGAAIIAALAAVGWVLVIMIIFIADTAAEALLPSHAPPAADTDAPEVRP